MFQHPIIGNVPLPPQGKLKWLGGNMGLSTPISSEVLDDEGSLLDMSLADVLARIDDFIGHRWGETIQKNLIANAFSAYEHGPMDSDERSTFEQYVRSNMDQLSGFEAARKLMAAQ